MIHCYEFYASPVISKPRYFELFFHFPWDFEIAGFDCIMLKNLSIMANMHVYWSLREGFSLPGSLWDYQVFSFSEIVPESNARLILFCETKRNETKYIGEREKLLIITRSAATHEIIPRLIVETASDRVDSTLYPRNHNRSAAKRVLFSWSLGYSKWR